MTALQHSHLKFVVLSIHVFAIRLTLTRYQHYHSMHALLALAASHLRSVSPEEKSHKVAEMYHWTRSLELFQSALQAPIQRENMDPLITTTLLLNFMSFAPADGYDSTQSWLFSDNPAALQWLSIQQGLRLLLTHTREYH